MISINTNTLSFENAFQYIQLQLPTLSSDILTLRKADFNEHLYLNNTELIQALDIVYKHLHSNHNYIPKCNLIEMHTFIYELLLRKLPSKNQEHAWLFRRNVFTIYHILHFIYSFKSVPRYNHKDIMNLTPFQRMLSFEYLLHYPNIKNTFVNDNYIIDRIIKVLNKYKNTFIIKEYFVYDILQMLYAECKIFLTYNTFNKEQILELLEINNGIISNILNSNDNMIITDINESQIKMFYQMVKCILYMAYYYNDKELFQYLKGNIQINQVSFLHGNSEYAKMISKNTTLILLYIRNIQHVINDNNNNKKIVHKIICTAIEITGLTLNYPDSYLYGLRRIIYQDKSIMECYLFNEELKENEIEFVEQMKSIYIKIEDTYRKYNKNIITKDEIENEISNHINKIFHIIDNNTFQSQIEIVYNINTIYNNKNNVQKKSPFKKNNSSSLFNSIIYNKLKKQQKEVKGITRYCYLMNKTPIVFSIIKSLYIILQKDNELIVSESYYNDLFRFLSYYIKDNEDNCLMLLIKDIFNNLLLLPTKNILTVVNLFEYIIMLLLRKQVHISNIRTIMKIIKNISNRINDKEYEHVIILEKVLVIINKLMKIPFLHYEHAFNKMRTNIKYIYNNNKTLKKIISYLLKKYNIPLTKNNIKINDNVTANEITNTSDREVNKIINYENLLTSLTKFLKIINFLFDGNSTLNENKFLHGIFTKMQLFQLLSNLNLNLPLRIELLKFFRLAYMDVVINPSTLTKYTSLFAKSIPKNNVINCHSPNFIFFEELLSINNNNLDMTIESDLINNELTCFSNVVQQASITLKKKTILYYLEEGIILPLHVFMNKYISIIYTLNGKQYIKLYEIILKFLELKKFILSKQSSFYDNNNDNLLISDYTVVNLFKELAKTKSNQYSYILKHLSKESENDVDIDIQKLMSKKIEILNYKMIYSYFDKHVKSFISNAVSKYLKEIYRKKTNIYTDEDKKTNMKEYIKYNKEINSKYLNKVFDIITKYENDKTHLTESALHKNLNEKNVLYNTTYRSVLIKPMFYLCTYTKYLHQNLWHIFRMLQYDTDGTQQDIYDIIRNEHNKHGGDETLNEIIITLTNSDNNIINNDSINLSYLLDVFTQNILSVIFASCNPTATSSNSDYIITYMIIKIFKYLCENHNIKFQTMFFTQTHIYINNEQYINMFDYMMCILNKIIILSKWEYVNNETDESSISYFYEIFFAIIEFSIEMIQGTTKSNLLKICIDNNEKEETSYFYDFLYNAKNIVLNNNSNSDIIHNIRLDIMNFISAFVEEKKTPNKIISMLSNLYSPLIIFESIITTLHKLYSNEINIKNNNNIFDKTKCDEFIKKYFSSEQFSENIQFELANRMYNYVKQLSKFGHRDAINIIESIHTYTEEQLIEYKDANDKSLQQNETYNTNTNDMLITDNAAFVIDSNFCQNYYAVKFFESITKLVWVQGKEEQPQMVLFTLNPSIMFLSDETKDNFIKNVPRDSRSTKLFSLLEHISYFYIEINHNKKRLSSNYCLSKLNKINYGIIDIIIFLILVTINLTIYSLAECIDIPNNFHSLYNIIFPMALIELCLTLLSLIMWFISKFSLFFLIEKEKFYDRMHKPKEEMLSCCEKFKLIIVYTLFKRPEIFNFFWYLIFCIIGLSSPKLLFTFSIQLLIVVNISTTLKNIVKAIVSRYKEILSSIMFLVILVYIFSSIAFFLLAHEFIHELEGNVENACGSLAYCFLTHLEFGLRTDGGIGDFTHKLNFDDNPSYFMGMFMYQFTFFACIIMIMLAVIGATIIDAFTELSNKTQEYEYDMNNVCFICGGSRSEIEKEGKMWEEHIEKVHNVWTYVDYMIGLMSVDPQETNAINSYVIEKVANKKISWLPSFKPHLTEEDNEENDEK